MCVYLYFDNKLNNHKYIRIASRGMTRTERISYIPNLPYSCTHTRATSIRPSSRPSHKSVILRAYSSVHLTREDTRDKVRAKSAQLHVPGKCVSALQRTAVPLSECVPTRYAVSRFAHAPIVASVQRRVTHADYGAGARVCIYIRVTRVLADRRNRD